MKGRLWRYALAITAFVVALVASGAWLAQTALRLERAELEARDRAQREEYARLALWRMESFITPMLGVESSRPASDYQVFDRADGADGELLIASPLLGETPPHVRLHFQIDADGHITTPQLPVAEERELALGRFTQAPRVERAAKLLAQLEKLISYERLAKALPGEASLGPASGRRFEATAKSPDRTEYEWRERAVGTTYGYGTASERVRVAVRRPGVERTVHLTEPSRATTTITPLWLGDELFLVRRARSGDREYLQAVWVAWDELSQALRQGIADLFPDARLEPLRADNGWRLASLPVALVPGAPAAQSQPSGPALRFPLTLAFAGLSLAALAMLVLALGALRLGERRAAFVSAVTHELRTPLTTLQTYAEMLRDGKITAPDKTQRYLDTMHREALRLARLVDNVLAYARIERGHRARREPVRLAELIGGMRAGLEERAGAAGMRLTVDIPENVTAMADPLALERIVDNLVDNACKYAAEGDDPEIAIAARVDGRSAVLRVSDRGPGLDPQVRPFVAFARSAEKAAGSAPGVGLGLALCRRLARAMGGDVRYVAGSPGAVFEIRLAR